MENSPKVSSEGSSKESKKMTPEEELKLVQYFFAGLPNFRDSMK